MIEEEKTCRICREGEENMINMRECTMTKNERRIDFLKEDAGLKSIEKGRAGDRREERRKSRR